MTSHYLLVRGIPARYLEMNYTAELFLQIYRFRALRQIDICSQLKGECIILWAFAVV
ncbi:hypothetical protein BGX38DRAFT_1219700 [Terfezia claveryi]|nr:hypothetical protein BGX38DRAFT_1219700 [Terfezia claveryi]